MIGTSFALLISLLALGIPVAAGLLLLGLILDQSFSFLPMWKALGDQAWGVGTDHILFAIPLYVLLGEILLRAGISERVRHQRFMDR